MNIKLIHRHSALSLPLNLLSEDEKKRIRSDIALYVVRDIFSLMLFAVLVIAVLLLISKLTLDRNYLDVIAATKLADAEQPAFTQKVLEVSSKSEGLLRIQSEWMPITPYVAAVTETIIGKASLSSLVVDRDEHSIHLSGHANTRTEVLGIQKSLESLPFSATVESPLSNILQPADIDFQFTIQIRNEKK